MYNDPTGHCNIFVSIKKCLEEAASYLDDLKNQAIANFEARRRDLTELYHARAKELTTRYHEARQAWKKAWHNLDLIWKGIVSFVDDNKRLFITMGLIAMGLSWLDFSFTAGVGPEIVGYMIIGLQAFSYGVTYKDSRNQGLSHNQARENARNISGFFNPPGFLRTGLLLIFGQIQWGWGFPL